MKIKKELFLEKLDAVKPGLSNKDIIEFADSISFTKGMMISYNDVIAVKCPVEMSIKGTVKADKLFAHMQKVKPDSDGYIKLMVKDEELIVKAGKSKAGMPINLDGQVSLEELGKPVKKWKKLPSDFTEGLRLSIFAASDDASDPKLTCLHIQGRQVQSSNGHRAFRYQMEKGIKKEFLLPATSAPSILNHPIKYYSVTKNWVHFKTKDDIVISCRMYADTTFPNMDFLFDINGKNFTFPDQLKEVITRAADFIGDDEDDKNIRIKIKKKKMIVKSKSLQGWFSEEVSVKSKKEASFEINPFFLQDILKSSTLAKMDSKKGLLRFKTDKWQYTINIAVD